jgi:acetyl-CoA carboxylase biotin carboxyl carrier protein
MHEVRTELTASVWKIIVPVGATVSQGDEIAILEAMKVEIPVEAPVSGVVTEFVVEEGTTVQAGDLLARISAD